MGAKTTMINTIYENVNAGLLSPAFQCAQELNEEICALLNTDGTNMTTEMIDALRKAIIIGNATYTNCDGTPPIDDGIWDLMVEKYRKFTPDDSYPVGFKTINEVPIQKQSDYTKPKKLFTNIPDWETETLNNMMYRDDIINPKYLLDTMGFIPTPITDNKYISKTLTDVAHNHPDLVGTFDKCKFVLNAQAREKGVENDPSVKIMERDFFKPLLDNGIIDYNTEFTMIVTIKYDGISVEADVSNRVLSARTRGDAIEDKAADITPILADYEFPKMRNASIIDNDPIGMKFEAIINYYNLAKFNELKEYNYKNCRTAMTGLFRSSDGYKYRDLITLVPISTDFKDGNGESLDRLVEIEFINKYYTREEPLRYSVLSGNYTQMLFQIKKYVEEAEFARSYLPFMYDGVVFEFYNTEIREKLGRSNAMDRYKCAIKFNPLVKQTIFRGYYFTIGQDGTITPMITYDPVEFFGTIHPNSSGHSYKNFKELDLHVGDIIDVTYRNDVITYVTKPDNEHNRRNAKNPYTELDSFPVYCPCCGSEIVISPSGKSARCMNINCNERIFQRIAATLAKLGVVNFGLETVRTMGYRDIVQYFIANEDDFAILGENNKVELKRQLDSIQKAPMYDYIYFGALGFDNMANKTWQIIFNSINYTDLVNGIADGIITPDNFPEIKSIGPATIKTIFDQWDIFYSAINYALFKFNLVSSYKAGNKIQIRFSGCRDSELETKLTLLGYDCDSKAGVTKKTNILLIPYEGFNQSGKISKAIRYGTRMVPIDQFKSNMNQYL